MTYMVNYTCSAHQNYLILIHTIANTDDTHSEHTGNDGPSPACSLKDAAAHHAETKLAL